jgi:hypothetical protein
MNTQDHSDYGSRAPAMLARPQKLEPIATGQLSTGRETKAERLKFTDDHLCDRLYAANQIDAIQLDIAHKALEMFVLAGINPRLVANYGQRAGGRECTDPTDINEPTATDKYRRLARSFGHRWALIEDMLMGHYCGPGKLASLRAVLDDLGDYFGI